MEKAFTKTMEFLTESIFGLFILVNVFFVAGLLAASSYGIGGLVWFGLNSALMIYTMNNKIKK